MVDPDPSDRDLDDRHWERGWEGHAAAQRLRLARLPMSEKLKWLEDAHRLVLHLQNHRTARRVNEETAS